MAEEGAKKGSLHESQTFRIEKIDCNSSQLCTTMFSVEGELIFVTSFTDVEIKGSVNYLPLTQETEHRDDQRFHNGSHAL